MVDTLAAHSAGGMGRHDDVAVARFGLGEWSFAEFLQSREKQLRVLQCQLNELDHSGTADSASFTSRRLPGKSITYFGPGIAGWPANGPNHVTWLPTAPVSGNPFYPVVLDVMESAMALAPQRLIAAAAATLAPTWAELEIYGLTDANTSKPRWDDVQGDDNDAREVYLLGAAARAIAALGPGFGVIFRGPQRYDHASTVFVHRLLREAQLTGFRVALEAPGSLASDLRYRDHLRQAITINGPLPIKLTPDARQRATALLAVSPQGLPTRVVEALGESVPSGSHICDGPGGEPWAFLNSALARIVRRSISTTSLRQLHSQLFDVWDPSGWGYLRRAGHAIAAKDFLRLQIQHTAYNYGLADIGRDFLYRQFSELSNAIAGERDDLEFALHSAMGAARLASRGRRAGVRTATRYYRRALRLTTDPAIQADLIYGLANLHARQRQSTSLRQAQRWYERGTGLLHLIAKPSDKAYMEIRFANGLALTKYHQGRNDEALALERKASAIAVSTQTSYPWLEVWATPIINGNIAKVLEKRFGDACGAIKVLESNLFVQDKLHEEYARLELARLYFDQQEHLKVIELLSALYDEACPTTLDEQQELFGRLVFSISLSISGDVARSRSQLARLTYLLHVADTPGASQLLSAIYQAAASQGPIHTQSAAMAV